jgi:hypothetical protein
MLQCSAVQVGASWLPALPRLSALARTRVPLEADRDAQALQRAQEGGGEDGSDSGSNIYMQETLLRPTWILARRLDKSPIEKLSVKLNPDHSVSILNSPNYGNFLTPSSSSVDIGSASRSWRFNYHSKGLGTLSIQFMNENSTLLHKVLLRAAADRTFSFRPQQQGEVLRYGSKFPSAWWPWGFSRVGHFVIDSADYSSSSTRNSGISSSSSSSSSSVDED